MLPIGGGVGKRLAVCATVLLWISGPVSAFDWGGSIFSYGSTTQDIETEWFAEGRTALWLDAPIGQRYALFSQAGFRALTDPEYVLDLDLLYLNGVSPIGDYAAVGVDLGRIVLQEFSGLAFEHRGDGALLSLFTRRAVMRIGGVYSGFLLKANNDVQMSILDIVEDRDDDEYFAPRRIVGLAELQFIEPLPRTDVTVAFVVQQDLRDGNDLIREGETERDDTRGGLVDTRYLLFGVDGALGSRWFYQLAGGLQFGRTLSYVTDPSDQSSYQYRDILAYIASAQMIHYSDGPRAARLGLRLLYSSGDRDYESLLEGNRSGDATQYRAVAAAPVGMVASAAPGNLMAAGVDYSLRPFGVGAHSRLAKLQSGVSALTLFRAEDAGPVDIAGVDRDGNGRYLGTEMGVSLVYRPFYDLAFGLAGAVLLPNQASGGPIEPDWRDPRYKVQLEASLSF